MIPTVYIMAAGASSRWVGEGSKHLAVINGETVIGRTERMLIERGIKPIITARYVGQWNNEFVTSPNEFEIDRICGVNMPAIYLYGDAYYTEKALTKILNCSDEWRFFGEAQREIFAIKANDFVLKKAWSVRNDYIEGKLRRCIGWELYAYCCNGEITDKHYNGKKLHHWTELKGCEDFDTVEEYEHFKTKLCKR
jgi:hypothetical protein